MKKHRSASVLRVLPSPGIARLVGCALLVLAAAVAIVQGGVGLGLTAWIGQMCVAAPLLVLVLSWRPNVAPPLAIAALACVPVLAAI